MSSVASTGYFLSLLPEHVRLGYLSRKEAIQQAEATLHFALENIKHHNGMLCHFVDWRTGKRWGRSEISVLDTAILLNGAITVAVAFDGEVAKLADALVDRVDWQRFVAERNNKRLLVLGWTPERGLLGPADVRSSEMAMAYFLAVGSRRYAISPECWYATRVRFGRLECQTIFNPSHGLFTSYYGLNWHRVEGMTDRDGVDLWANAIDAARANRKFCRREGNRYPTYAVANGSWWGISAGDSPDGYIAPSPVPDNADGIVWPMTALAALPFLAEEIRQDLVGWYASGKWHDVSGPYGLVPFRLQQGRNWRGCDLIGIDLGSFAVSLANHRNGTVWNLWMRHEVAQLALDRLAFQRKE